MVQNYLVEMLIFSFIPLITQIWGFIFVLYSLKNVNLSKEYEKLLKFLFQLIFRKWTHVSKKVQNYLVEMVFFSLIPLITLK